MIGGNKELAIVEYSAAAVKTLHFCVENHSSCFALHWHDRMEIIIIKKGNMTVEYCGEQILLKQDEMIVVLPRMAHKGYTTDSYVEYDVLMFDIQSFYNKTAVSHEMLPQIFNGSAKFETVISKKEIIKCVDEICNNKNLHSLEIISLVYKFLYLLYENHLTELNKESNRSVTQFIDYIEENFALDLNTAMLSRKFGYCPEHFCRKFKEATGITPMTYLKIYRLEQALKKIQTSEQSISEIATQCGYYDANYFTRCFKAHYGVPPSYYKPRV
jgi:AraC-like DNA-binding protein